jgi:hypothetical protein
MSLYGLSETSFVKTIWHETLGIRGQNEVSYNAWHRQLYAGFYEFQCFTRDILTHHWQGHFHCGESTGQARVRVFSSEQIPTFSSSASSLTPNLRSERTKVRTLSTFASVLCIFGCPLLGSFYASSGPSLNRLGHSITLDFFISCSP